MGQIERFADIPAEYIDADTAAIVLLPVPYDRTSTWIKGADKGPRAIIDASVNLEWYDIETDSQVYKKGIHIADPLDVDCEPEQMVARVESKVDELLNRNKFTVLIGGEHSVSIGSITAHCRTNEDVTILQLDAHADLRDQYEGSRYNHACTMARVTECAPIVQVGLRSMDICEKDSVVAENAFFARDIHDNTQWMDKALSRLSDNVYITIDLDVFDPSIMPATGTPEPGGLLWYQVLTFLKKVFETRNVIGFDVAELCPNPTSKPANYLAAKLIYKLLTYKFCL